MDTRKMVLYGALALVVFMLWTAWQREHPDQPQSTTSTTTTQVQSEQPAQTTTKGGASTVVTPAQALLPKGQIVRVRTDLLDMQIDTAGGTIVGARLLKYPKTLKDKTPIRILSEKTNTLYVAQSGIIGPSGKNADAVYKAAKNNYQLKEGQDGLTVRMVTRTKQGIILTKIFTFRRDSYAVDVAYQITNPTSKSWRARPYTQIKQRQPAKQKGGMFYMHTYQGPAISSAKKPYEKVGYKKLDEANLDRNVEGGWVAIQQRYFLSSWVPPQDKMHHYYSNVTNGDDASKKIYTLGIMGPAIDVASHATAKTSAKFYVGPEIKERLEPLAKGLPLTIDYGWLFFISVAIFWVMQKIYDLIGNWGWSIVIVTILIKACFYHLSNTSYRSMAKMRDLGPRIKMLKERFGDDKQKLSQATMELYKKEKINPLGGCLPMIIQIPFFFALYYVLIEAVQLRQAPFIFWIHDLSAKDPYYILPVLMGLSMFLQQKLSPAPPDPMQAKMMMLMPVVFTALFFNFPAGLVLYWTVNNVLSVWQQWYVMKKLETAKAGGKAGKKKKK